MPDLDAVHGRLREILRRNAGSMTVSRDSQAGVVIEMPDYEGKPWATSPERGWASAT